MATFNWPAGLRVESFDCGVQFNVRMNVAVNGAMQTFGLGPAARWVCRLTFPTDLEARQRPALEALLINLEGGAHRLSMHHLGRPLPIGSLRGTPTLGASVARGDTSLTLVNANGGLKAGDIIGLPGQFLMVMADANPVLTDLTVHVKPAVRNAHNSGTPVTWNKPSTLWIPRSTIAGPFGYTPNKVRPGFSVDLVEVWI